MPSDAVLAAPSARGTLLQPIVLRLLTVGFLGFVFVYIAIPLLVTLLMSFNDGQLIRFPINAWSTRWYGDFFASPQRTQALWNSLQIAVGTNGLDIGDGGVKGAIRRTSDRPTQCVGGEGCGKRRPVVKQHSGSQVHT